MRATVLNGPRSPAPKTRLDSTATRTSVASRLPPSLIFEERREGKHQQVARIERSEIRDSPINRHRRPPGFASAQPGLQLLLQPLPQCFLHRDMVSSSSGGMYGLWGSE